jgi:hypothetical protein
MRHRLARLVLWLFVIDLGIAFGAGLYESRVELPRWIRGAKASEFNAPAARAANSGMRFWLYTTTVPLTVLTLASFIVLRWTDAETRKWWLIAACAALGDRILTFAYFIPTMVHLMSGLEPNAQAVAFRWSQANWIRHGLSLVAWLAALQAFALFARPKRRHTHPRLAIAERGSAISEMELRV